MSEIVVSVIVPIYNGSMYVDTLVLMIEKYFQIANKVMGRMQEEVFMTELILIDDGSKDDTYSKCMKYSGQYPWIRFIHTENHGVSHARNVGIDAAKGKWIQFLDVDDVIEMELFKAFYSLDADLLVCGCKRLHGNREAVFCGPKEDALLSGSKFLELYDQLQMEDRYWLLDYCWNKWYKKSIIDVHNIRFEESMSLGEDFVFNTRYMQCIHSLGLIKECYYHYCVGEQGLVSKFQKEPWIGRTKQYEAQKELYQSLGAWEKNRTSIDYHYGQIAFGDLRMINSPNCLYTLKEKKEFIHKVMDSSMYDWILRYLEGRNSKLFQIYAYAWKKRNTAWILFFIQIEKGKMHLFR